MEGVGRNEILNWINDLLQLDYKKIEQMGSGAALCQIIDVIHPGRINLKMVNFNAKYDYEYVKNFSYLQEAFAKIGIEKYVEVSELVKSRPQANLEFCQWLKKYFDQFYNGEPYNALERRQQLKILTDRDRVLLKGKTGAPTASKPAASKPTPSIKPTTTTATTSKPAATTTAKPASTTSKPATTTTSKPSASSVKPASSKPVPTTTTSKPIPSTTTSSKPSITTPVKTPQSTPAKTTTTGKPTLSQPSTFKPSVQKSVSPTPTSTPSPASAELQKELEDYKNQVQELTEKVQSLSDNIKEIGADRDFYFERLRAAEIYCQENPNEAVLKNVLSILYNTEPVEDENGEEIIQDEQQEEEEEEEEVEQVNETLSEPEPENEQNDNDDEDIDVRHAAENLSINPEDEQDIEDDQQLEEQIGEEEIDEIIQDEEEDDEERVNGLNEKEIMDRLQEENDELLDSTFDEGNELIADEEEY